ncbi:hypothetical protein CL2_31380 [Anaerostipes hadrus]|uniref:Uncharacterized protein n=1 Tax=Anaerostipes hadrus TaxID=649756 RepID=D4MWY1_ANAHA|nr:hypothetical protein CL2_31380 [Anaerostipes hadrus]
MWYKTDLMEQILTSESAKQMHNANINKTIICSIVCSSLAKIHNIYYRLL